jgi:hypothetical protein
MRQFIVTVVDKEGEDWVFEGWVKQKPIFTKKKDGGTPKHLSMVEAQYVVETNQIDGESYMIEGVS